jgi:PTS system nitrogen regulatory IIA component
MADPIAGLLAPEDVLLDLGVADKRALLAEVGRFLELRHELPQGLVAEGLGARERLGSTGLGQGVAIPHARIPCLQAPVAALVRTRTAISFDSPDGKPVWGMAVLLVPGRADEGHLELLALIAHMFADRPFRDRFRACADAGEARRLFAACLHV